MIPPNTVDIGQCRRCWRTIRFVILNTGRRLPVQYDPDPYGRVAAWYDETRGQYTDAGFPGVEVLESRFFRGARFTPHSDTCRPKRSRT